MVPLIAYRRLGVVGPSTEQNQWSQSVKASASACRYGTSADVRYPMLIVPKAANPSRRPSAQYACCGNQPWRGSVLVHAVELFAVSRWYGSRYPSGWNTVSCYQIGRPSLRRRTVGSANPRTPGRVPK